MSKECSNGLLKTAIGHNHYLFSIVVSDYLSQHSSFFKMNLLSMEQCFFIVVKFCHLVCKITK